ncbi:hypothetical protein CFC21_041389 [Triticum aestivum]|uniref:Uncharacterized protein n=2 Tax=Triticum aestivum TaxID=4565 RepID=A0A3B6FLH9_WHEAT|nr:hypothetical protein CFC21_041389 [Triticum aestivum]
MAAAKIAVLLAATALFAAAGAADPQPPPAGNETQCWQCYSTCMHKCDNSSSGDVQKYFQCKKSCILDCYKELPPVCFKMCISQTCLTLPPDKQVDCYKACGTKCFHNQPYPGPNPGPKPPTPPGPPKPMPPPRPPKPMPPAVARATKANPAESHLMRPRQSRSRRAGH